jgi:hypothetical protein
MRDQKDPSAVMRPGRNGLFGIQGSPKQVARMWLAPVTGQAGPHRGGPLDQPAR